MSHFSWNKYKIKYRFHQCKQQTKYWWCRIKEIAKQIFIPLAILQLIRTIFFPTPFDVFLLVVIFVIIIIFLIDWQ